MYGNLISRMGQQFGYPGQPGMGAMYPPKGMPTAPVNPPKTYLPQWQGMGQRAEFGANFGADRGRNGLLQLFRQHFRPQQYGQQPQQPNSLNPYGIAPGRDIY